MNPVNNDTQSLARVAEIISKNSAGVIVLPQNPTIDAVASATSLYLALTKMGKSITLACATAVNSDLTATDKIQPDISVSGDNLVVSFPYSDGSIDKVDYNIQGENFNLIITPRPGYPKLKQNQVKFSYAGGSFQFIITIDSPNLNSLGEVYENNSNQFQGKDLINIDRHLTNSQYGTVNLINKTISSVTELVFKVIQELRVEIDKDIATNLYAGIAASTNNFTSYSVNAHTFETIAHLLRMGAIKKTFKKPTPTISPVNLPQARQFPPQSFQPSKTRETQPTKQIETVEKEPTPDEKPATPQDWLKPKIFRGGGLI